MQCLEQASLFNGLAVNSLLAPEQGISERGTGNLSRGSGKIFAAARRIAQGETSPAGKVLGIATALSSAIVIPENHRRRPQARYAARLVTVRRRLEKEIGAIAAANRAANQSCFGAGCVGVKPLLIQ